jgi:hypothetical protein
MLINFTFAEIIQFLILLKSKTKCELILINKLTPNQSLCGFLFCYFQIAQRFLKSAKKTPFFVLF